MQQDLRSMNLEEMAALLAEVGQPAFRAKQLFGWVHQKQVAHIEQMHNLGKPLLSYLEQHCKITVMELERKQVSRDGTEKFLFRLADGNDIECVLMRYRGDLSKQRNTLCISSQVGCAMGCTFCATGQGGFVRNLTVGEIVSQVYEVNRHLQEEGDELPVGNVVFMGMGEPLLNLDHSFASHWFAESSARAADRYSAYHRFYLWDCAKAAGTGAAKAGFGFGGVLACA